jgi:hypothetical protein
LINEILQSLSPHQREFVQNEADKIFVAAAPGSGKTYVTAVKLINELQTWDNDSCGIATLSFTNIAESEISSKVASLTGGRIDAAKHPHFIGTLDGFINQFIFLPYGHLILGCKGRPKLVGGPHGSFFRSDYIKGHFEYTGFDIDDSNKLISLRRYPQPPWQNARTMNAIIKSKKSFLRAGYANQYDANFIALQLLIRYPIIARILARRFPYFIIDEVQDSTDLHLRLLQTIFEAGTKKIAFIGDLDQAIFGWNKADIDKLKAVVEPFTRLGLPDNRRSSQEICDFVLPLSSHESMSAMNDKVKNFTFKPRIIGYDDLPVAIDEFRSLLSQEGVMETRDNVAILCRSTKLVESVMKHVSGLTEVAAEIETNTERLWASDESYNELFIQGLAEIRNGHSKIGYDDMCRAIIQKKQHKDIRPSDFTEIKDDYELFDVRCALQVAIKEASQYENLPVGEWSNYLNGILEADVLLNGVVFNCKQGIDDTIQDILNLKSSATVDLPLRIGTIHTAKGETIENVMVCIDKRFGNAKAYKTMISNSTRGVAQACTEEEMRVVYVGLTRASKRVILAVPNVDLQVWRNFLFANKNTLVE